MNSSKAQQNFSQSIKVLIKKWRGILFSPLFFLNKISNKSFIKLKLFKEDNIIVK